MKRIILSAAVAVVASVVNASAVNWGLSSAVDTTKYASGTAYLICVDNMAKPTLSDDTAAAWYQTNGGNLGTVAFRSASVANGLVYESEDIAQAIGRKNYFLVIVSGDEKNFAVSTTTKALNITTGSLSQTASWVNTQMTSFSTTSVPEPTSGLMLLLGVAGLALRRRRV